MAIIPLLDPIRQPDDAAAEPVANVSTGAGRASAMSGSLTGGRSGGRRGFTSRHPRHRLDDGVSGLEQLRPDLRADPGPLGRSDVAAFGDRDIVDEIRVLVGVLPVVALHD